MGTKSTPIMKLGSDKVIQAWTSNAKENRVLEKKLQTLHLEQDYAIKLLDLRSREVKVNNKRLKGRVSKIKSYLTPEEITELRTLELEGKLKPEYNQVRVNGATRIAAAAKRLKMDSLARARAVTVSRPVTAMSSRPPTRAASTIPDTRRNSVSEPPPSPPPESKDSSSSSSSETIKLPLEKRPATSSGFTRDLPPISARSPRCKSVRGTSPKPMRRKSSVYSSHHRSSTASTAISERSSRFSSRKLSIISDDSIDNNFTNKAEIEEHRQELIENEREHAEDLKVEQKNFLAQVAGWIKENPTVLHRDSFIESAVKEPIMEVSSSRTRRRKNQGRVDFDKEKTQISVEESWKDLNKCRYLRISEELVDLSGVVTLATEHMKLHNSMRNRSYEEDTLE